MYRMWYMSVVVSFLEMVQEQINIETLKSKRSINPLRFCQIFCHFSKKLKLAECKPVSARNHDSVKKGKAHKSTK